MNLEDQEILARLPPRVVGTQPLHPSQIDFLTTSVERYVRDAIESQMPIPMAEIVLEPLMEALYVRGISPPVPIGVLASVLESDLDPKMVNQWSKEYASLMPRLLKTLNGENFPLVMPNVLREAIEKEKVMAGMPHGWGVSDPPVYATCTRLLLSAGLLAFLLPPYKTLPPSIRGRLSHAWKGACSQLGWDAREPFEDVRAEQRRQKTRVMPYTY